MVISKVNILRLPSLLHPSPSNRLEINKPRPGGGELRGYTVLKENLNITKPHYGKQISGTLDDCFL